MSKLLERLIDKYMLLRHERGLLIEELEVLRNKISDMECPSRNLFSAICRLCPKKDFGCSYYNPYQSGIEKEECFSKTIDNKPQGGKEETKCN